MISDRNTGVDVRRVANGWMVRPPYDFQNDGRCEEIHIYVFTSWVELAEWLKERLRALEPYPAGRQIEDGMTMQIKRIDQDDDDSEVIALRSVHRRISAENTFLRHTLDELKAEILKMRKDIEAGLQTVAKIRAGAAKRGIKHA